MLVTDPDRIKKARRHIRLRSPGKEAPMKIAIAGAGTTGAYAYRLLKKRGLHADVYQRDCRTACGINPCAWERHWILLSL